MERADVNGSQTQPVYEFLRSGRFSDPIEWNTAFIVGRDGEVIDRFAKTISTELNKRMSAWLA